MRIPENAKLKLPLSVFFLTFILLAFVQLKVERPILLAERFIGGGGWIEIFVVALYGAFVAHKMEDPARAPAWRRITWTVFAVVFFLQLLLGLSVSEKFLMSGKLHLPIPMMIIGGPLYRAQLSVMTILFISTVILTGPAWCSQFCYFGAFDNLSAAGKTTRGVLQNKWAVKSSILALVIISALMLRWLGAGPGLTTVLAIIFGVVGIILMAAFSAKKKKMVHCVMYCPVGTLVNIFSKANPFRLAIGNSCTLCMKCTGWCKYDALSPADIKQMRPASGCTLCGDCLAGCHNGSIQYRFLTMNPVKSRNLWIVLTISIHAACLALARI